MRSTRETGLEDALIAWYRNTLVSHRDGSRSTEARVLEEELDATFARGDVPSLDFRRNLDQLGRDEVRDLLAAGIDHHGPAMMRMRRIVRQVLGSSPHRTTLRVDATPTRVLHAIANLRIGGAQQLVIDLARTAKDPRDHLTVTSEAKLRFHPRIRYRETAPIRSDVDAAFDAAAPDVVHVCHFHSSPTAKAWYELIFEAAIERDLPIVQSHCVIGDPWMGSTRQHLVFCSDWSRDRSGVEGIPDSVISPGTPIELFRRPRHPVARAPRIGMVYRLEGDKIDPASGEVIARILEEVPHATMTVVGDGAVRAPMEKLVERRGVDGRVEWRGLVTFEELPGIYESFDVVIAPVRADTFGSGSVHAICGGTPVVGYDVAAIPSILRHEAALVPYGDADAFADAVRNLLEDDGLHEEVHRTQLEHAERNFDLPVMCTRYHERFAQVANDGIQGDVV